jgi:hypothetical protein
MSSRVYGPVWRKALCVAFVGRAGIRVGCFQCESLEWAFVGVALNFEHFKFSGWNNLQRDYNFVVIKQIDPNEINQAQQLRVTKHCLLQFGNMFRLSLSNGHPQAQDLYCLA